MFGTILLAWAAVLSAAPPGGGPAACARRGLEQQVAAWNRGDIEGALAFYWNSPMMTWVSKSGVERGFAAFADGMRKDFAKAPETMGTYSADVLETRGLGRDDALLVTRWQITRGGKRLMGGISTQVWRRAGRRCVVVLEHAS